MPGPQAYIALVDASGNLLSVNSPLVLPGGRITLTTATPVLTTTVSASANVLYTPYLNNYIPIWSGSVWQPTTFAELTNVLANSSVGNAGPAAGAASKNYDLFVWNSSGTLYLTRGAAWNSDTARSATTENDLQRVQGVLCNLNAITNGPAAGFGTYVGTVRTDSGGATVTFSITTSGAGGSLGAIGVWNMYNQVLATCRVQDTNASWNYSTATVRPADNNNANRINLIAGLNQVVKAQYVGGCTMAAAAGAFAEVGIGLDVTNAFSGPKSRHSTSAANATSGVPVGQYDALLGLGFHFLQACEIGDGTNTTTFLGNNAALQGLYADWWC